MLNTDILLDHVDLVALAERAGAKFTHPHSANPRSVCPLHGGDNPTAFSVYTENGRQLWKCHTGPQCGGGDAIHFVRQWRKLDFLDAVRWLATDTSIALESLGFTPQAVQEHARRERRADVLELAAKYYQARFWRHTGAQAYARGRGFNDDILRCAGFGYSDGRGLGQWLEKRGGDLDAVGGARETGLLRRDGLDFTANANGQAASPKGWLIYVHRERGRVMYLSARALSPINPSDKSRNLPGTKQLYRAEVNGDRGVALVEGQADAESLRQLGYSAWALCGKTLSEADVNALSRRKPVYLVLDNDVAGQERLSAIAGQIGPLTMIAPPLPDGRKDFNEWLQAGAERELVAQLLKSATPWIDRLVAEARDCPAYALDERLAVIATQIAVLPESLQGRYLKQAAKALNVSVKDLRQRMEKPPASGPEAAGPQLAEVRENCLCFMGEPLCNFDARITHELTVDDGQNPTQVRYTLQGQLDTGEPLKPLDLPAEEFTSMRWLSQWGARVIVRVNPSREWMIRRAIQELSQSGLKRESVYTFTGWAAPNGQRAFLTAGGAITADGLQPDVRVDLGSNTLTMYALPAPPEDPRAAVQASLGFLDLAPLSITAILWAAMYAAPLTPLHALNAVIWLYGTTQSMKSTLAMLALCHFGPKFVKGREYKAPKDWLSTFTDLEGAMFALKDVPLVIDDYAPQDTDSDARALRQKANQVIRSVGNRSARGRANADLSERAQRPPRGLVIATAEHALTVQSIVGRMIYVPVEKGAVRAARDGESDSLLDRAQALAGMGGAGLYAGAMSAYVRWLARNWQALEETLGLEHETASQAARSLFPSNWSRLMDYYAVLLTGAKAALRFGLECRAIAQNQHDRLAHEVIPAALADVLAQQAGRISDQSPVRRFVEALADLLTQGRVCLVARNSQLNGEAKSGAQLVGWYEPQTPVVYLLTNVSLALARDYWLKVGEGFDIRPEGLWREMEQAGLIASRDDRQFTRKLWMGRDFGNQRVLVLDDNKVEVFAGVGLWPERLLAANEA
jgi:DNA primase